MKKLDIILLNFFLLCVLYVILIVPFKLKSFGFDYFNNIKSGYGIDVHFDNYRLNKAEQRYIVNELNDVNIFDKSFFKVKKITVMIPFDIKDGISYGNINIDVEIEKYDDNKIKKIINSSTSKFEKVNKVDINNDHISLLFSRRLIGINTICETEICSIFVNATRYAKNIFNFKLFVRFVLIIIILVIINLLINYVDNRNKNKNKS